MDTMKIIVSKIRRFSFIKTAYAHCDIPCGIYDPKAAQTAAQTVLKMTQKLNDLSKETANVAEERQAEHDIARLTLVKEEHGRICKNELFTLWADYFKPEHLELFPDLHTTFWNCVKLVSYTKQHVDIAKAEELVKAVDEIADMFNKTKKAV
jgi:nickel superoxide dismutase